MQTDAVVERRCQRTGVVLAALLSCVLHGCTNVTGGAVELSWDLETVTGSPVHDCLHDSASGTDRITTMRLWWQVNLTRDSHEFDCRDNHGVTGFDVPPGQALLWVEPQCAPGTPVCPQDYIAPAPLERTITLGDVVELHAVEIEVNAGLVCSTTCM